MYPMPYFGPAECFQHFAVINLTVQWRRGRYHSHIQRSHSHGVRRKKPDPNMDIWFHLYNLLKQIGETQPPCVATHSGGKRRYAMMAEAGWPGWWVQKGIWGHVRASSVSIPDWWSRGNLLYNNSLSRTFMFCSPLSTSMAFHHTF